MNVDTFALLLMVYLTVWIVLIECFYDKPHFVGRFLRKAEKLFRLSTVTLLILLLLAQQIQLQQIQQIQLIPHSFYEFVLFFLFPTLLIPGAIFYGYPNFWAGTHKRRMNKQSVKQFRELCERFAKNESIIITFIEEKDIDGCLSVLFHTDRALPNDINFRLTCWLASQDKANYQNMAGWFMSDYFSLRDEPSIEKNLA